MAEKKLNPQVVELIEYLRQSGTGKSKLEALTTLAGECDNGREFIEQASKVVPEGTMKKILAYVGPLSTQPGPAPMTPKPPTTPPAEATKPVEEKEAKETKRGKRSEQHPDPAKEAAGKS